MKNAKLTLAALALTVVSTAALAHNDRTTNDRMHRDAATTPANQSQYNQFSSSYRQPSEALSPAYVQEVQEALSSRGFYRGRIDGNWGSQTTAALRSYQKSVGDEKPATKAASAKPAAAKPAATKRKRA